MEREESRINESIDINSYTFWSEIGHTVVVIIFVVFVLRIRV